MAHTKRSLFVRSLVSSFIVCSLAALSSACGDDDPPSDPKASCDSMCKKTGFTSSNLRDEGHELNCFCQGSGTVTEEACTEMCTDLGKGGQPFGSGGNGPNACQCQ